VKSELEDLSFRYIKPKEHDELKVRVELAAKQRYSFIEDVKKTLQEKMRESEIPAIVTGRVKIPLLLDQPTDNLGHLRMDHRFATGNTNDRGATFHSRRQTLFNRKPLIQHMIRILNLPAAGAGQITSEERLQHQHERIPLHPAQLLGEHILRDSCHLGKWNSHSSLSFFSIYIGNGGGQLPD
jgi:hypothetical protein